MPFVKYSPAKKRSNKPLITISSKAFHLNKESQKFFNHKEFAELYFDADKKQVGIKPLDRETESSLMVRKYPQKSIALISASGFISRFAIDRSLSHGKLDKDPKSIGPARVEAEWDEREKMILLKLK